jgi:hypothetical protein
MKVKSFGCSFVAGTDLAHSNLAWPALVAERLGLEYQCLAAAGVGNSYIQHQVLNHLKLEPCIYIINWTWIDRFDYVNCYDNTWQSLMPSESNPHASYYYKHLHSQYRDKFTSLTAIKTVRDALRSQRQRFIMTYMDSLLFETEWHSDAAVEFLQQDITYDLHTFNGHTFLDWSRLQGYAESDTWHPLEAAHSAAADYAMQNLVPILNK